MASDPSWQRWELSGEIRVGDVEDVCGGLSVLRTLVGDAGGSMGGG